MSGQTRFRNGDLQNKMQNKNILFQDKLIKSGVKPALSLFCKAKKSVLKIINLDRMMSGYHVQGLGLGFAPADRYAAPVKHEIRRADIGQPFGFVNNR